MKRLNRNADLLFLKPRRAPVSSFSNDDEEMGFVGMISAIGSAIGAAVKGGKAIAAAAKKKKAKKASKAAAKAASDKPAGTPLAIDTFAQSIDELEDDIEESEDNISELLSKIPETVRNDMTFALTNFKQALAADKSELTNLVTAISGQFSPYMDAVMKTLEDKQLQTQATNEHNVIVKSDKRWEANTKNQQLILERLDLLERRLGGDIRANELRNAKTAAAFGMPSKLGA
jgi:hypothetical protein